MSFQITLLHSLTSTAPSVVSGDLSCNSLSSAIFLSFLMSVDLGWQPVAVEL